MNEYNIRVRFLRQLEFYGSVPWYLHGKCIIACELSNYTNHISLPYTFMWTRKIKSYYQRIRFFRTRRVLLQIAGEISNHALHEFYYIYANNFLFFGISNIKQTHHIELSIEQMKIYRNAVVRRLHPFIIQAHNVCYWGHRRIVRWKRRPSKVWGPVTGKNEQVIKIRLSLKRMSYVYNYIMKKKPSFVRN